jgi:PAS domain S-box-containing protein
MKVLKKNHINWWASYKIQVRNVIMTTVPIDRGTVSFWRNEAFCKILTYLFPLSLIALVPSLYMALTSGLLGVAFIDLFAFLVIAVLTIVPGISIEIRKAIFIFILYALSVTLLFLLPLPGPGLLFLLAVTIVSSLVYSSSAAYISSWTNTAICVVFAIFLVFGVRPAFFIQISLGAWIAISSNLILLSFACAKCLDLLLSGLTSSLKDNILSEARLEKANRLYQFISNINQTIVHVKDAETLFRKSCEIAVEYGRYKMAWIGGFDDGHENITILDACGTSERDIDLFTDADFDKNGLHDFVLSTGSYFLCNDIASCPEIENWKTYAERHQIGSCLVLPIRKSGIIFGTFNFYATEPDYFDKDHVDILVEVTGDISFAIDVLEKAERQEEAELELQRNYAELEVLTKEQSAILNTLPASIALVDNEGAIIKVNDEWINFGLTNGLTDSYNHINSNYIKVSAKSSGKDELEGIQMANGLREVLKGEREYFSMEYPCDSPSEKRWYKAEVRPIKGNLLHGAVVMHVNISERKRAEAEMILLVNNTEESFILLNSELKIVSHNKQFENLYKDYFGFDIRKGDSILDYARPERRETVAAIYRKVLKGSVEESEIVIPLPDNIFKHFSIKYNPAKDEFGEIFGVFVTAVDVTEKRKAEEQKEFERRDKEALINSTDDLIWSISTDLKLIAANRAFINEIKKGTGVDVKQGEDFLNFDVYPPEYLMYWKSIYERANSGESFKIELHNPSIAGSEESWSEASFNPIIINGQIIGSACYSRNITERKKAELEIRGSEMRLAEAQSLAKIGNWEIDFQNCSVIWSAQTSRIFDGNPDTIDTIQPGFLSYVHHDDLDKVAQAFKDSLSGETINTIEHRIVTKSGEIKFLQQHWQIFHDVDIPVKAIGTCQDITDRKKSENENKFKAELLDTIGQAVIATDLDGQITFWNKAAEDIYGWPLEEALGKNILELTPSVEMFAFAQDLIQKFSQGESWSGEFYVQRKDGKQFPAFVHNSPVYDEFGKQTGIIGVSNDISERKESELERTRITNDLLQRNRDLEQFTFIISHNLRAPTANIIGFTEFLQDETLSLEERKDLLKGLESSVSGLDNVIKDINTILQVKREINEKKEKISFSKLVTDIITSIGNKIDVHQVDIRVDFSEVDEIFSLKVYLHSIFYNLISNSIKFRKPYEQPRIEIKSKEENGKILLIFKDNGLGMDMKTKGDKIFKLYSRFHSHVEGKGMGLFMVKTQVEAIGGSISLESELNKGTVFKIEFEV